MTRLLVMVTALCCVIAEAGETMVPILDTTTLGLLGGAQGHGLHNAKSSYPVLKNNSGRSFRLYTAASGGSRLFKLSSIKPSEDEPCHESVDIELRQDVGRGIALPSDVAWNPQPRPIEPLNRLNATYLKIIRDLLVQKGLTHPIARIKEIYRTDLEGDGRDEVIIVAEHYAQAVPPGRARVDANVGDYSFVLVRKIVGTAVLNILFEESIHLVDRAESGQLAYDLAIVSIADINGDGKMELMVNSSYYEGSFTVAYRIGQDTAKDLLISGCGL